MSGLEAFKKGYIWRVGDGTQIDIWSDNWLRPVNPSLRVLTPKGRNLVQKVSDLINPVLGQWDEELVRDIFGQLMLNLYCQFR